MADWVVGDRYQVGGRIGAGATGEVHAAEDRRLGRPVAIKILPEGAGPAAARELHEQALRAARLNHPGIVRILDLGTDDGRPWVAMDLVDGATVDVLLADGPLGITDVLDLAIGVLAALSHAHARGVLHLDLSPANIMVTRTADGAMSPRLIDIGGSALTSDGLVRVSPHYASPEVARGRRADARSDVYSLGAVLFHLLTGRSPVGEVGAADALAAQVRENTPTVSARLMLAPGVRASGLERVLVRALAKDPERRYSDAAAMRAALVDLRDRQVREAGPAELRPVGALHLDACHAPHGAPRIRTAEQAPVPPRAARLAVAAPLGRSRAPVAAGMVVVGVLVAIGLTVSSTVAGSEPAASTVTSDVPPSSAEPSASAPVSVTTRAAPTPTVVVTPVDVVVPDLVGLQDSVARSQLAAAGLQVGTVSAADSPESQGTVLASIPAAAAPASPGDAVALVVASGWQVVPDVAGLAPAEARAVLIAAGFAAAPEDGSTGAVVETVPARESRQPVGAEILLVLAGATAGPSTTPVPTTTPVSTSVPTTGPASAAMRQP